MQVLSIVGTSDKVKMTGFAGDYERAGPWEWINAHGVSLKYHTSWSLWKSGSKLYSSQNKDLGVCCFEQVAQSYFLKNHV